MPDKTDLYKILLVVLFNTLLCLPACCSAFEKDTAIFLSSKIRPYVQALQGLTANLTGTYQVFDLTENYQLAEHYAEKGGFFAAVAIGPEATRLLFRSDKGNFHIKISIMTLDIAKLLRGKRVCGIDLRVPVEFQLKVIKQYLGAGKRIAILFNRKENEEIVFKAKKQAINLELTIIPLEVDSPSQIMERLNGVLPELDLILFIPDSVVISEKIITHIAKKALLSGVAIGGFNSFFYDSGALISFVIDYEKIGRQAAVLLEKMSSGYKCEIQNPNVQILLNTKVLNILRKTAPDKWSSVPVARYFREGEKK